MESTFLMYKNFKAVDFFQDEVFSSSAFSSKEDDLLFWHALGDTYPELRLEMETAKKWILLIRKQPIREQSASAEVIWQNIQDKLPIYARRQTRLYRVQTITRWSARIAAVFLAVMLIYEISHLGPKSAKTTFGERREVVLPDESMIDLNSNSKISYVRDWKSDKPREVWLTGEAMFEVKHTAILNRLRENDRFVVHVADLALTVLGTKFNVKERRGRIEVTLFEGSLQITGGNGIEKLLVPGETFVYDQHAKTEQLLKKDVAKVSSWTRGELDIEHANLSNIVEVLEDNYGYKVILTDSNLLEKRLTGTIPVSKVKDILFVIKHTMDVNIQVKDKEITINSK
ncbi:DUF4974 domain-containing protein [Sphingobacterium alkalisoli]|uniref:DUF4974 domain-containing protein n=1 Tax=Sphingobacterium alkalisoli TaxID=1874115 RepID=A0A4U0GUR6_9SPHI|nr:FecR domain-containing protein [Sphingobacterium alkalisoli]TJY62763.1 DUF4974 domain-containing protein [Sphingobacterium alkalisoli]GGH28728.1 hypothetical protein GCM10011418_39560 [Sphingobacterium alkalisoli]